MLVTEMISVGYQHDECRHTLPSMADCRSKVLEVLCLANIKKPIFELQSLEDWSSDWRYQDNNKGYCIHLISTLSLVSSITRNYVLCLISFNNPQVTTLLQLPGIKILVEKCNTLCQNNK